MAKLSNNYIFNITLFFKIYSHLGIPYVVTVVTGDRDNAATSANVFIVMYGGDDGNQSSGKIWLQGGKFKRDRSDIFNIEVATMLSPLSRIDIGHDNSGPGAGWFLDRVCLIWFFCKWIPQLYFTCV